MECSERMQFVAGGMFSILTTSNSVFAANYRHYSGSSWHLWLGPQRGHVNGGRFLRILLLMLASRRARFVSSKSVSVRMRRGYVIGRQMDPNRSWTLDAVDFILAVTFNMSYNFTKKLTNFRASFNATTTTTTIITTTTTTATTANNNNHNNSNSNEIVTQCRACCYRRIEYPDTLS